MKYILPLFIVSFFLVLNSYHPGQVSAGQKEVYELQERCGKHAAEYFKQEYGSGISNIKDEQQTADYSNHYNKKLNKCFVLLTVTNIPYKDKDFRRFKMLFDLNEHKEYGGFLQFGNNKPTLCKVSDTSCNSEAEWEALAKPFMEE